LAAVLTLLSSQTKTFFELNNGDSYILYVAMYLEALKYAYLKNTRIVNVFRVWIVEYDFVVCFDEWLFFRRLADSETARIMKSAAKVMPKCGVQMPHIATG
jgi:hypothetical protein